MNLWCNNEINNGNKFKLLKFVCSSCLGSRHNPSCSFHSHQNLVIIAGVLQRQHISPLWNQRCGDDDVGIRRRWCLFGVTTILFYVKTNPRFSLAVVVIVLSVFDPPVCFPSGGFPCNSASTPCARSSCWFSGGQTLRASVASSLWIQSSWWFPCGGQIIRTFVLWTTNRPVSDEEPCCCAGGCGKLELSTHLSYNCVHVHELTKLVRKKYVYFCILIRGLHTHWHNTHNTLNVTVWLICCDRRCWRLVLVGGSWWSCGVRACAPCELSSLPLSHTWVLWLWVHIIKFPQIPLQKLQLVFV